MVSIRARKSKGSQFEYNAQASLKQIYPDIYRTSERGFQMQYDLRSDAFKAVIECKRLRAISWNQAKKYLLKLAENAPEGYSKYLLFKSNQQPCLVMTWISGILVVMTFESLFKIPFIKHKSTRVRIR